MHPARFRVQGARSLGKESDERRYLDHPVRVESLAGDAAARCPTPPFQIDWLIYLQARGLWSSLTRHPVSEPAIHLMAAILPAAPGVSKPAQSAAAKRARHKRAP